jgi:hypothetical protein
MPSYCRILTPKCIKTHLTRFRSSQVKKSMVNNEYKQVENGAQLVNRYNEFSVDLHDD